MVRDVDDALLAKMPLPSVRDGGKEERGSVLVLAGTAEMPGSAILSAEAALRAGAGKVAILTAEKAAPIVAAAVPEARVIALAHTADGRLTGELPVSLPSHPDSLLLGPGLEPSPAVNQLVAALLKKNPRVAAILDAGAMDLLLDHSPPRRDLLITPHARELEHLGIGTEASNRKSPHASAAKAARRFRAGVALKGPITWVVFPRADALRHDGGNPGLGISGSGDVLSGIIAGLVARGANLRTAAAWGVALHARAGDQLARRIGPLGYLARELSAEVPRLMVAV